jgi:hypothetical protein
LAFWTTADLENKLLDFRTYFNNHRNTYLIGGANAGYAHVTTNSQSPLISMATTLSSPLSDPSGCLICQRVALAVVLVDLGNTSKEIIRCFSIAARFADLIVHSNRIQGDCRYNRLP